MTQLITELINDEAVYRTAPAAPGLLNTATLFILGVQEAPGLASLLCNVGCSVKLIVWPIKFVPQGWLFSILGC